MQPRGGEKGPLKNPCTDPPSLYVGETGRSLHERSREHWDSYRNGSKDSHILKHHLLHHNGEGEPEMVFKVVGKYRSALSRQVGEAVKIRRRGGEGSLLNSKGEFNRCKITRLTLEEQPKKSVQEDQSVENEDQLLEGEQYGEQIILGRREQADKRSLSNIGKYQGAPKGAKRTNSIGEEPKKSKKKRKFELVGSRWGLEEGSIGAKLDVLVGTESQKEKVIAKEVGDMNSEGGARAPLNFKKNEFENKTPLDKGEKIGEESNGEKKCGERGESCGESPSETNGDLDRNGDKASANMNGDEGEIAQMKRGECVDEEPICGELVQDRGEDKLISGEVTREADGDLYLDRNGEKVANNSLDNEGEMTQMKRKECGDDELICGEQAQDLSIASGEDDQVCGDKDEKGEEHDEYKTKGSGEVRGDKPTVVVNKNQQRIEKFFQKMPTGSRPSQKPSTNGSTKKDGDNGVMSTKKSVVRLFDCVVRKQYCTTHEKPAVRIVSSRTCWTRNRKTGLYSFVQRKVTGWRCEGGTALEIST